jgi:hypothetical protein
MTRLYFTILPRYVQSAKALVLPAMVTRPGRVATGIPGDADMRLRVTAAADIRPD